jgi:hypothetical protein
MSLHCSKCGGNLDDNFKFCPECGKNLKGSFFFCAECGKKMTNTEKEKSIETAPATSDTKKEKTEFKLPKFLTGIPKKTLIIIIAIICIVAVVGATAIILNPFNGGAGTGGRIFTLTITNDFSSNAHCYILTDYLKQGVYGNAGFIVYANDEEIITINEDDLMTLRDAHNIELRVTIDDIEEAATATAVTDSANFIIDNVEGTVDLFYVNCTVYD